MRAQTFPLVDRIKDMMMRRQVNAPRKAHFAASDDVWRVSLRYGAQLCEHGISICSGVIELYFTISVSLSLACLFNGHVVPVRSSCSARCRNKLAGNGRCLRCSRAHPWRPRPCSTFHIITDVQLKGINHTVGKQTHHSRRKSTAFQKWNITPNKIDYYLTRIFTLHKNQLLNFKLSFLLCIISGSETVDFFIK